MKTMTLEQFRAVAHAGGVTDVTLAGEGSGFFVQIATKAAGHAVLAKARSTSVKQLAAEIQEAIDDPAPGIPHEQVMEEMEAEIDAT
jgi:hypothetical protein